MTDFENLMYNLSAYKHDYYTIYPTALQQLDHMLSVIGNGYGYDSVAGIYAEPQGNSPMRFLSDKLDFDFNAMQAKRDRNLEKMQESFNELKDIFGNEIPERFNERYESDFAVIKEPFNVKPTSYYYDHEQIAAEYIAYGKTENERYTFSKFIGTPYPLNSEHSLICKITPGDNPIYINLALATSKAWLIVLDYYVQNGIFLSEAEVEKLGGASYYDSLEYIQKCIVDLKSIVTDHERNYE